MRLHTILKTLTRKFPLKIIEEEVSDTDVTYIALHSKENNILLFKNVLNKNMPILTNIVNTREKIKYILNAEDDAELYMRILDACSNPLKAEEIDVNETEFIKNKVSDLSFLPILKFFPKDPGPYITSGIVIAMGPKSRVINASIHRLLVLNKRKLVIRIVPRHLWRLYNEAVAMKKPLPVAIVIGTHPLVLLAAASSPPFGVNELEAANRLLEGKLRIAKSPIFGIPVPVDSEIVIEGKILLETADEGPFVDATGTYDIVRKQPIVEIEAIWVSPNPIYYTIVPSSKEHLLLMGLYKEALVWDYVRRIVPVKKVRLTWGGCHWLHAAISIKKMSEGDGKNAIMAAFSAHPSLKHVIVVDEDIDVDKPEEIEWALATRFQASKDLVIIRGARGSSLDPSADQEKMITDKMGLDATKPLNKPPQEFEKVKISPSTRAINILNKINKY